jgi:hypothetical protein
MGMVKLVALAFLAAIGCGNNDGPLVPPPDTIEFTMQDNCADGLGADIRYFDVTNNLAWPVATVADLGSRVDVLACHLGAQICYGARAGSRIWGMGIDGAGAPGGAYCATCQNNRATGGLTCQ